MNKNTSWSAFLRKRPWPDQALRLAIIGVGFVACAALVYEVGGADSEYTYLTLLPIILAAAWFGLPGGVLGGMAGGFLLGPYMPEVLGETGQAMQDWGPRFILFTFTGLVVGSLHAQLWQQAHSVIEAASRDPDTDLPNRYALLRELEWQLAEPHARNNPSVLLLRVMDLEDVIDVLGIESTYVVMRELARRVTRGCEAARQSYLFGTDQLALIVEAEDTEELKRIAQTVHDIAGASFEIHGVPVRIQPAIGVGRNGDSTGVGAGEYVRRSRVALRHSVLRGRDWVSYEPELDTSQSSAMTLIARVEEALEAGEFQLHYQPKLRLDNGQLAGVEALVRWYHEPGESAVSPSEFMPKLEKTSLIDDLSDFVIRTGIGFAQANPQVPVSINLAARNLSNPMLIDALIARVRDAGIPPEYFEVEITESSLMQDPDKSMMLLRRLRDNGVGVALDDFGTGYSSFAYLREVPATSLKIDRAFVRPLASDAKARRLVQSMIEMGHALKLRVTAEGIETEEQAKILAEAGCDYGQGFLWSAARSEQEMDMWLDVRQRFTT